MSGPSGIYSVRAHPDRAVHDALQSRTRTKLGRVSRSKLVAITDQRGTASRTDYESGVYALTLRRIRDTGREDEP
jgi:hypothetical protein